MSMFPIGIWLILFDFSSLSLEVVIGNYNAHMSVEPRLKPYFYASMVSGIVSFAAAMLYLSKLSNSKTVLMSLVLVFTAQAVYGLWYLAWDMKVMYSFPAIMAYLTYKNPNNKIKPTPENCVN